MANSRQASRTPHSRQMDLAVRVDAPRSGKNRSALAPLQLAPSCQDRSPTARTSLRSSSMVLQNYTDVIIARGARAAQVRIPSEPFLFGRGEREILRAE